MCTKMMLFSHLFIKHQGKKKNNNVYIIHENSTHPITKEKFFCIICFFFKKIFQNNMSAQIVHIVKKFQGKKNWFTLQHTCTHTFIHTIPLTFKLAGQTQMIDLLSFVYLHLAIVLSKDSSININLCNFLVISLFV